MKALIIVDMLKDFLPGGVIACDRGPLIIEPIRFLLSQFREKGFPVIYANDSHLPEIDFEFKLWGAHAVRGEVGSEVIEDLKPVRSDYIVLKRRYSAFSGTDLNFLLIEKNVDSLVFVGLHTDICIRHSVYDAFLQGYQIEVIEDAVNAFTERRHLEGLEYLKQVYGALIVQSGKFKF